MFKLIDSSILNCFGDFFTVAFESLHTTKSHNNSNELSTFVETEPYVTRILDTKISISIDQGTWSIIDLPPVFSSDRLITDGEIDLGHSRSITASCQQ